MPPSATGNPPRPPDRTALLTYHATTPPTVREADLARAQQTLYEIDGAQSLDQRLKLAHAALSICPLCADAFCLLAAEIKNAERARALYALGVAAGGLALGLDGLARCRGRAWLYVDARPYLRARLGLALRLIELGADADAIAHFRAMLDLNPGDNQGARYPLLAALWRQSDGDGVAQLLDLIGDEGSLAWVYSRALVAYRRDGHGHPEVATLGRLALDANPHVPALFAQGLPLTRPNEARMGGPEDAAEFVLGYGDAWRATAGAVAWIVRLATERAPAARRPES